MKPTNIVYTGFEVKIDKENFTVYSAQVISQMGVFVPKGTVTNSFKLYRLLM